MAAPKPLIIGFKYVPQFNGDEGLVLPFPEAAGQTFVQNDLVSIASGQITAVAAGVAGAVVLLGTAEQAASGVTNRLCKVRVWRPGDIFIANFISGTTFSAATHVNVTGYDVTAAAGNPQVNVTATNTKVVVLGSAEVTPLEAVITPFTGIGGGSATLATSGGPIYVKVKANTSTIFYAN